MKQQREFGEYLRNIYANFLSEYYNRNEVFVKSTDYNITLMSTNSLLSGLFPSKDNKIFNDSLIWQPITVNTADKSTDIVR
jgi:lysosomal acid phosphatase